MVSVSSSSPPCFLLLAAAVTVILAAQLISERRALDHTRPDALHESYSRAENKINSMRTTISNTRPASIHQPSPSQSFLTAEVPQAASELTASSGQGHDDIKVIADKVNACSQFENGVVLFLLHNTSMPVSRQLQSLALIVSSLALVRSDVAIALITDVTFSADTNTFVKSLTCIINVAHETTQRLRTPQKSSTLPSVDWAALWLLGWSPFASSLALQGGVAACADIATIWPMLLDFDLLLSPRGSEFSSEMYSTSVIAFRKGQRLETMLRTLSLLLPGTGAKAALYYSAQQAVADDSLFRVGSLATSWLIGFNSGFNKNSRAQSLISPPGHVFFVDIEPPSSSAASSRCSWLNADNVRNSTRMIAYDGNKASAGGAPMFMSSSECVSDGRFVCSGPGMNWTSSSRPFRIFVAMPGAPARYGDLSAGVAFFGYSTDYNRTLRYVAAIRQSAWSVKTKNPSLPIALFTNIDLAPSPPFSHVVRIADGDVELPPRVDRRGGGWNILTRVRYHDRSPFNLTVQIDSDRIVCGSLAPLFEHLASGWDFLSTSAGSFPLMDHGVIAMRAGPRLIILLHAWARRIIERGDEGRDEQQALVDVRDKIPGLKIGFAPPTWQAKYTPANNMGGEECLADTSHSRCSIMHTLVLHGYIHIYSADPTTLDGSDGICRWANTAAPRPRVFVHDKLSGEYVTVFSKEECDRVTRNQCNHSELNWKEEWSTHVIPAATMLR